MKLQTKRKKLMTQQRKPTNQKSHQEADQHSVEDKERQRKRMLSELPRYVEGCFKEHSATKLECTTKIRELLSITTSAPIAEVMASGVVPQMIAFLSVREAPKLQLEALWVLTNLASSDNPQFTMEIVTSGCVPPILAVLQSSAPVLQEQALWVLGNIAGESVQMRDMLVGEGTCMATLVQTSRHLSCPPRDDAQLQEQFLALLCTLSWSLSNFSRHKNLEEVHCRQMVECLYCLLQHLEELKVKMPFANVTEVQTNIGWSFSYLTDDNSNAHYDEILNLMMKHGITVKLIGFLDSNEMHTCTSILRTIGNVLTGPDRFTAQCVDSGVLSKLFVLLCRFHAENVNHAKLKEVLWALSNIAASDQLAHIKAVVDHRSFDVVVSILKDSRTVIAAEALWTVSNATSSCNTALIHGLLSKGIIEALCAFWNKLNCCSSKEKMLRISFECVENVLGMDSAQSLRARDDFEEFGGLDFLEELQSDDRISQDLYEHTVRLIQRFWPEDTGDENAPPHSLDHLQPTTNDNQFGFGLHTKKVEEQTAFAF